MTEPTERTKILTLRNNGLRIQSDRSFRWLVCRGGESVSSRQASAVESIDRFATATLYRDGKLIVVTLDGADLTTSGVGLSAETVRGSPKIAWFAIDERLVMVNRHHLRKTTLVKHDDPIPQIALAIPKAIKELRDDEWSVVVLEFDNHYLLLALDLDDCRTACEALIGTPRFDSSKPRSLEFIKEEQSFDY